MQEEKDPQSSGSKGRRRVIPLLVVVVVMACAPFLSGWLRRHEVSWPIRSLVVASGVAALMGLGYAVARRYWPSSTVAPVKVRGGRIFLALAICALASVLADIGSGLIDQAECRTKPSPECR